MYVRRFPIPGCAVSRRFLHTILAIWTIAASTCCEVAHAHDDGDEPHSHHLGLVTASADQPTDDHHGPVTRHRHLILFGIEAGCLADDPCDSDANGESGFSVGFECVKAAATADTDDQVAASDFAPVPLTTIPEHRGTAAAAKNADAYTSLVPVLCAKAAHARSGVRVT
jgi:hypothetical protein